MSTKTELLAYVAMLEKVSTRIRTSVKAGKTLEAVLAEKPTAEFDEKLGKGFLTPESFVRILYTDLAR